MRAVSFIVAASFVACSGGAGPPIKPEHGRDSPPSSRDAPPSSRDDPNPHASCLPCDRSYSCFDLVSKQTSPLKTKSAAGACKAGEVSFTCDGSVLLAGLEIGSWSRESDQVYLVDVVTQGATYHLRCTPIPDPQPAPGNAP